MWKQNLSLFKHVPTLNENVITEAFENETTSNFQLVESKQEVPTLQAEIDGRQLFIHSKYNPIQEAKRIVSRAQTDIEVRNHIIFYGVGLGYHIEKVFEAYPDKQCTIIEPNLDVFLRFLESRSLDNFPTNQVKAIYVPTESMSLHQFITGLMTDLRGDASVVILPAYERIFKADVAQFFGLYQNALKTIRSTVAAQRAFSKRWTINSLKNVPKTVTTQNIREKIDYFKGKPIIIAAAGPSLYEDLDHLKYIKEKGLAYIFAVGSANKAFIAHNVTPDAVLTYDPQPHNVSVFRELNASGRTDIPMIYGTSVGFETTEVYPGPLFHFVNSADTVTNYYLGKPAGTFDVHDSTTITLVAIQVAEMLQASTIILAGQNLAFKENRYYADGISHGEWKGEVRKNREGKEVLLTTDVHGNQIETNESLNNMRRDIELYIERQPNLQIINTTKKGADIAGAPFTPIEKLMKEELTEKVVVDHWYAEHETDIAQETKAQVDKMDRAINQMYNLITKVDETIQKLSSLNATNNLQRVNRTFQSLDQIFNRLLNNDLYKHMIEPILKFETEQLRKLVQESKAEQDLQERITMITTAYTSYLDAVQEMFNEMAVHIQSSVHPQLEANEKMTFYAHHDGVFDYEGDWKRETVTFDDLSRGETVRKLSETISTKTSEKGATIKFRFEGTMLQLFTQTDNTFSSDIVLTIDGTERKVRTKSQQVREGLLPKQYEQVLEVRALANEMHDVTIEVLSDEPFHFQGIAINKGGRVYHPDEVTTVEKLEVGKRIRCHIKSSDENRIAILDSLGTVVTKRMNLDSTNETIDFYIEKVYERGSDSRFVTNRNINIVKAFYDSGKHMHEFNLNIVPVLTSNETNVVKVSASTHFKTNYNTWDAYKAFNNKKNNTSEAWATNRGVTEGWLTLEFSEAKRISCYTMTSQSPSPFYNSELRMPTSWKLEGLIDYEWELIDEQSNIKNWNINEKKLFRINNNNYYKTYRFKFIKNNGDDYYLSIGEIEIN